MNIGDIELMNKVKIVFMGTPDFSVPALEGLIENYNVKAIVTQPDKLVGRNAVLTPSPVKNCGYKHNILVLQPKKIKEEYADILKLKPDLIITCAYGQILPKEILNYPKYGCINIHASLLPKLRGGAPIHRAIIEGHTETGITIMYMAEGMDSGDIISQAAIPITDNDTAESMHDKLSILGKELILKTLPSILNESNQRIEQNKDEVTYAFNIKPEDEKLDFTKTKREIYNKIRGLYSWPGAYCIFKGKRLKVWEAKIGDNYSNEHLDGEIIAIYKDGIGVKVDNGEIIITKLQLEGKKRMTASEFINGFGKDNLMGAMLS